MLKVTKDKAEIETVDGVTGEIPLSLLAWARHAEKGHNIGPVPTSVEQVLHKGDVVYVEKLPKK